MTRRRSPVTAGSSIYSYGFWGQHGFAALEIGSGPLSGEVDGTAFSGDFSFARAYAVGEVSGTNPTGAGSATWRGIAEASPAGTYELEVQVFNWGRTDTGPRYENLKVAGIGSGAKDLELRLKRAQAGGG